jgi:hypothetical protein
MSSLHALVGLASALNNADADGRIIVDTAAKTLKFVLLNAGAHFVKVPFLPAQFHSCSLTVAQSSLACHACISKRHLGCRCSHLRMQWCWHQARWHPCRP